MCNRSCIPAVKNLFPTKYQISLQLMQIIGILAALLVCRPEIAFQQFLKIIWSEDQSPNNHERKLLASITLKRQMYWGLPDDA